MSNSNNNEIVIKKEEIYDYVDSFCANQIGDIYDIIKKECEFNCLPILDKPTYNSYGNFIEMVMDCLNTNEIYRDKNKLDV